MADVLLIAMYRIVARMVFRSRRILERVRRTKIKENLGRVLRSSVESPGVIHSG
jgi:hypothetical protein